jgi:hypothetical protein
MAIPFASSIANMFRPTQQVSIAPSSQPMQQENPGAAAQPPTSGTSAPVGNQVPPNPLDEFTGLWQNDPKMQQRVDPLSTPLFNTDPAAISAAAAKLDLVGQLPPELMAKAMSGQDPAAFMQVLNSVAQRTLATATQLNAATIEQATTRNNARIQEVLPSRMKDIQLQSMQSEHPALQHPASQPFLQLVRSQVKMKNPGMSAADINAQAERALLGFANQLVAPAQAEATRAATAGGTDWDAWAS